MKFKMCAREWKVAKWLPSDFPELEKLIECEIGDVNFNAEIKNTMANSGQVSLEDFDQQFKRRLIHLGGKHEPAPEIDLEKRMLPDVCLRFEQGKESYLALMEIEKANWEKLLRDLLKLHAYLSSGADVGVLVVPENHAHKAGEVNQVRWAELLWGSALKVGMWNGQFRRRIIVASFRMYDLESGQPYGITVRDRFQRMARGAI